MLKTGAGFLEGLRRPRLISLVSLKSQRRRLADVGLRRCFFLPQLFSHQRHIVVSRQFSFRGLKILQQFLRVNPRVKETRSPHLVGKAFLAFRGRLKHRLLVVVRYLLELLIRVYPGRTFPQPPQRFFRGRQVGISRSLQKLLVSFQVVDAARRRHSPTPQRVNRAARGKYQKVMLLSVCGAPVFCSVIRNLKNLARQETRNRP